MTLKATSPRHAKQIAAGAAGRNNGHRFERILAMELNAINLKKNYKRTIQSKSAHLFLEMPALALIQYIEKCEQIKIVKIKAWWVGGLATSSDGDKLIDEQQRIVKKCKSDIVLDVWASNGKKLRIGVSVKSCSNKNPTNAQMYFTTAAAFCDLLQQNGINVPQNARKALSRFCGDANYRPKDLLTAQQLEKRSPNQDRFFWEELSTKARKQWEKIFSNYQDAITKLLFQKAYKDDPYPPSYLIHATHKSVNFSSQETAIYTIDEIVKESSNFSGFKETNYSIKKGTYKGDTYIHKAPSFGFIQFQRGGQKQHPTQLQFNLKAGYYSKKVDP